MTEKPVLTRQSPAPRHLLDAPPDFCLYLTHAEKDALMDALRDHAEAKAQSIDGLMSVEARIEEAEVIGTLMRLERRLAAADDEPEEEVDAGGAG